MATFNPGQFSAIQNGANSGSLVSQLFGNRQPVSPFIRTGAAASPVLPQPNMSTPYGPQVAVNKPYSTSPNVQASTSAVQNKNTPTNASIPSTPAPLTPPVNQPIGQLLYNGVPASGAPGTLGNNGPITQNNSTPNSPNGAIPGQTFTTPSGAEISSTGSLLSTPPVTPQSAANTETGYAGGNIPIGQTAAQIQATAGQQEKQVAEQAAGLENAYGTTPGMAFPTSQGLAASAAGTAGQVEQGIAAGAATALQGTAQELEAQNQAATATNAAGNLAAPSTQFSLLGQGTNAVNSQGEPVISTPVIAPVGSQASYPIVPNTPGETQSGNTPNNTYTIKPGDTFFALEGGDPAKIAAIEQANPGIDPNNLQPGQKINLPNTGTQSPGNSPYTAGIVAGTEGISANLPTLKAAYSQAQGIQGNINTLLSTNPSINSSPVAIANAINQWVNAQQIPNGPYVSFLQDLQEFANTIAPILGVGANTTDLKTQIATQMVPTILSGGTTEQALNNLMTVAAGKINAQQSIAENPYAPVTSPSAAPSGNTISTSLGTYITNAQGQVIFKPK